MTRILSFAFAATIVLARCPTALADLQGMEDYSLEWLVDSSDAIAVAEIAADRPSDWNRSVADDYGIKQVIKGHKQLRAGQSVKGYSELGVKGNQVILFLREKSGVLSVFNAVNFSTPFALRSESVGADKSWKTYLALDKKGQVISSREQMIRLIEERMKAGSSVPADCDREAVEQKRSVRGGFWISGDTYELGQDGKVLSSVCIDLVVPADPEFKEQAKKTLADPKHRGPFLSRDRVRAILEENYPAPTPGKKPHLPAETKQ